MRRPSWTPRWKSVVASVALVSVTGAGLVLASRADGLPPTHADLNDGGVWVTSASDANGLVARFFVPVDQQDVPGPGLGPGFDVAQRGADIVLVSSQGDIQSWNPVSNAPAGEARHLGTATTVRLGGEESSDPGQSRSVTALLDQSTGDLRIVATRDLPTFDVAKVEPVRTLGAKADVAVGADGSVVAVSVQDRQVVVFPAGPGAEPEVSGIPGELSGGELALTTVGSSPVVLDAAGQKVLLPDGHIEPVAGFGNRLVLQQPGPESTSVLLGTPQGMVEVPLERGPAHLLGDPRSGVDSPRSVVAPVRLPSGCARGAVVTAGAVELLDAECPGRPEARARELLARNGQPIDVARIGALVFRVNHGLSVLNDTDTGAVWNPEDIELRQRDDWTKVEQKSQTKPRTDNSRTTPRVCKTAGATNTLPTVANDTVSARPGVPVVVDVLRNDRDADCDVLAIDGQDIAVSPEGAATADLVGDGRRLQVTPQPGAGQVSVAYFVTDGRGARVPATLSVRVVGAGVENAPKLVNPAKTPTTTAIRGKSVSYNVLGDWMDPDGDPLQLTSASVPGGEGDAVFQPDGLVTYTDGGTRVGKVTVTVGVSDGQRTTYGKLVIDVQPPGADLKPIARDDYARGVVGQPLELRLLANDADPNGNPLHIGKVRVVSSTGAAASKLVIDSSDETRTVVSLNPRDMAGSAASFALEYDLVAGRASAVGRARVDFVAAGRNRPPAPQVDVTAVQVGVSTEIDVLRNDVDPDGDVLAITDIDTHGHDEVLAGAQGSATVRLQLLQTITTPVQITYSVTDGRSSPVPCVIVISQAPTRTTVQPPVARPDTMTVRAGGMVAIPVLRNDSANSGGALVLSQRLAELPTEGTAYVDGDLVRYLAPTKPGVDNLAYSVTDSGDATRPATGRVSIQIIPADDKNQPPRPLTVSARAVRSADASVVPPTVTIPVPLAGTDPDGDQVVIDNPDVSDEFHNRVSLAPSGDSVLYTPISTRTGTDHVRYRVCDVHPQRACAEGVIQVAVFTRESNDAPTTTPDSVVMLPGHTVSVDVLTNDADPDGDQVRFADPALGTLPTGFTAKAGDGGRLSITAPKEEGTFALTYFVTDRPGTPTRVGGSVTVTVDPTAPLQPPIARDDVVSWQEVADAVRAGSSTVKVDVLANDSDPDASAAQLQVADVPGTEGASASPDKKFLLVTLGTTWRTVAYQAVDADGRAAVAFVAVPPQGNAPPLQATAAPLEVGLGKEVAVPVSAFAVDPDNGPSPLSFVLTRAPTASSGTPRFETETVIKVLAPPPAAQGQPPAQIEISAVVTDGKAEVLLHATVRVIVDNRPPSFTPPTVVVERVLGGPPTSVSLVTAAAVTDPDAADAGSRPVFTAGQGTAAGVNWTLSDAGELALVPTEQAKAGTSFQLKVRVADSHGAETDGAVTVKVVTTTRPPLTAAALTEANVKQGGSTVVDVVAKNHDPFEGTSRPLSIVSAGVSARADVAVTVDGGSIRIDASDTASPGWIVVDYRITDAADRTADGTVRVPVWGRPDPPTTVNVDSTTGRTVSLSWTPGKTNITSANPDDQAVTYIVSAPGVPSVTTSATSATVLNLTPGNEYTFTVKAHNVVGDSVAGTSVGPVVPDAVPPAPVVRVLTDPTTFDKDHLTIEWSQPAPPEGVDGASAIDRYTISYGSSYVGSLPTAHGVVYGTGSHRLVLTGLTMGESYNISLCPENKATAAGATPNCSEPPAQGVPIGMPAEVTGQTANGLNAAGTSTVVTATWSPVTGPGMGGDTSVNYRCTLLNASGSAVGATVTTAISSCSMAAVAGTTYTVKIQTGNDKGWTTGVVTGPVTPRSPPSQVQSLAVSATGNDRELRVTFLPPSDDGCNGNCASRLRYEYNIDGGGWAGLSGSGAVIPVPANGVQYTIGVRANNAIDGAGTGLPGQPDYKLAPAAYGPPAQPSLAYARGRETVIEAAWSTPSGYNPYGVRTELAISGLFGWSAVAANSSGSWNTGGIGGSYSVSVRACEAGGQGRCTAASTLTAQTMILSASKGPLQKKTGVCTDVSCAWLAIGISNGLPNHGYTFMDCGTFGGASCGTYRFTVTTDGNGNAYAATNTFLFGYPRYEAYSCIAGTSWCTNRVGW